MEVQAISSTLRSVYAWDADVCYPLGHGSWNLATLGLKKAIGGSLGGAAIWRLPLAQGAILETRDRIPHRALGAWSLLLPLPVSASLSLSLSVTIIKKKKKKNKFKKRMF